MLSDQLTFESFCRQFDTEPACVDALFHSKWPDGFRCPSCNHTRFYLIRTRRLPLYECSSCRHQTSIIAGTIMEGSTTALTRWFKAMFLVAQPSGVSSSQLSRVIKVTYKTAWLMTHKIRHAMQRADAGEPLMGALRVDSFSYGYTLFPDAPQPFLIGASLDSNNDPSHVKIKQPDPVHVNNESRLITKPGVHAFLRDHTDVNASPFISLFKYCKRHPELIQISRRLTTWLNSTFHGIGSKHLQAYMDEFSFRLNLEHRKTSIIGKLLDWCSIIPPIIYKELTRFKPVLPVPWLVWGSKSKWKGYHLNLWGA